MASLRVENGTSLIQSLVMKTRMMIWRFWDFSDDDDDDASEDDYSEELDSDESSGKEWSDLEAEAAKDGRNRGDDDGDRRKGGSSSSSCRDRDRYVFYAILLQKLILGKV